MARTFLILGALNGFLAVALGAFGAHGIRHLVSSELYSVFQTGVQYHALHVPALLVTGLLALRGPTSALAWCGGLFCAGILLFSGSLYLLVLTDARTVGTVTPVGGVLLLGGWLMLGRHAWRLPANTGDR